MTAACADHIVSAQSWGNECEGIPQCLETCHVTNNLDWIVFLLIGDAALLEAAKKGNLARVQKLVSPQNINCRDTQGRNSTPLHLAGFSFCINSVR